MNGVCRTKDLWAGEEAAYSRITGQQMWLDHRCHDVQELYEPKSSQTVYHTCQIQKAIRKSTFTF